MRLSLAAFAAAALLAAPPTDAATRRAAATSPPAGPARDAARAKQQKPQPRTPAHPDIGDAAATDCASCHQRVTPDVEAAWRQGQHGLSLVKCFVCHGSTGDDFARTPPPDRCAGCHAEQVASLQQGGKIMKGKDCFSCHEPHALTPHAVRPAETVAARLGADAELARERRSGPVNGPAAPPPPYTPPPAAAQAPGSPSQPAVPGAAKPSPSASSAAVPPQAAGTPQTAPQPPKDTSTAQPHPPTDQPQGNTR